MTQPTVLAGKGDCFLAAWQLALTADDAVLCHGIVRGRSNMKGQTFWHAWVEVDGVAVDFSNGRRARMPVDHYYLLCAISSFQVRRYDRTAAEAEAARYHTCGPWPPPLR